ncbi:branched-chain amino acid transport system II carrier protein [Niameybacter massiliensis]|uniref:Branched-chain amino acid transport system carrier protein n=1 Tax=Holtiella tumoricola TaxID=3018743 RepID=A0AA42J0P1_9FIRM|nr:MULTISPECIES: branched-chain amino acid transport system II carrier protein [Lachnospirales]MDA3731614.1 branched-chain amino acid transport system II carrier protein [Holtiella tumoricola]
MKKNQSMQEIIILGFALFAMFFGSGNLIFPPFLGRLVGEQYLVACIGFIAMGVGLPLLGVMATAKADGQFHLVAERVGKVFSIVLMTALILAIGPFLAIPRTAATTFEMSIRPFLPNLSPVIVIALYFCLTLFFVFKPGKVIDVIGKFLTPALLVILAIIIIKGIFIPIGPLTENTIEHVFTTSLIEGYQTMDALAAVCFGGLIVANLKQKGYSDTSSIIKATLKSSLIALVGLGLIYGGLIFVGAHTSTLVGEYEKTALVIEITRQILGEMGAVFLALAVGLACLTTSIGLTTTGANYFSNLSKGRLSYNLVAVLISLLSFAIALLGVDNIVGLTVPVLKILYPMIIVLVIFTLAGKVVDDDRIYRITTYVTLIVSILDVLGQSFKIEFLQNIISYLPFAAYDFSWLIPAVVALILTKFFVIFKTKKA